MTDERSIQDDLDDEGKPEKRRIEWFNSDITGEFYFRFIGDNDIQIGASQGYTTKDAMFDTLDEYFDNWKVVEDQS